MKRKRMLSALLVVAMAATMFAGCGNKGGSNSSTQGGKAANDGDIKEFTAFFAVPGSEINDDNEVQQIIAEKTGVKVKETWLTGQTAEEAIGTLVAGDEYPDFICGGNGMPQLYDAGALVALDDYIDKYPNIKNYFTEQEWDQLRQDDGHIYWIPPFCVSQGENVEVTHTGEAFWIQTRVLKWAGYPKITTVDEYFDLIEAYVQENPAMPDGTPNIPFTVLCDDWRFFCLENVPQFLAGYPNDGSCMVDPGNDQVIDYNTTETARRYFQKLNEEYRKGNFDPQSFTSTYEEYMDKLGTGAVLGMVDQWWQFYYNLAEPYETNGLSDLGCDYVPLPITMDKGTSNQWHTSRSAEMDTSSGLSITTSCEDVQGALQFVNDLLDSDITKLRFWGEKDLDYSVDENGMFYMDSEQGKRHGDSMLNESHFCPYSYFPRVEGLLDDGINAFSMEYQPVEFMKSLKPDIRECFEAYGVQNYVELLGTNEAPGAWYPMYSYTQSLSSKSKGGMIRDEIDAVKRSWLPQVIMSDDFASTWDAYMAAYQECNPQDYFDILQRHVDQILQ